MPRKVKFRKSHKGRKRGKVNASARTALSFGKFGLKSEGHAWVTSQQLEAARRAMTRFIKKGGKIWIRIFPDKPITRKAAEVPMGAGKGSIEYYVARIKPGHMLFEIDGLEEGAAKEALRLAAHKLPVRTKIITRLRHD